MPLFRATAAAGSARRRRRGSCVAAEALGIPSVMIAAPGFVKQAKSAAASAGLGELRVAEYPGAFASHTREELLANTRKVLWPQVKSGLTGGRPSPAAANAARGDTRPPSITGTLAEIQKIFLDSGWTDGLPIVPPTEEAVAEFLRFTDLKSDHSLGADSARRTGVRKLLGQSRQRVRSGEMSARLP